MYLTPAHRSTGTCVADLKVVPTNYTRWICAVNERQPLTLPYRSSYRNVCNICSRTKQIFPTNRLNKKTFLETRRTPFYGKSAKCWQKMHGTRDSRRECNNTRIQEASSRASSRSFTHPWSVLFVRILLAIFPAAFHMKRKEFARRRIQKAHPFGRTIFSRFFIFNVFNVLGRLTFKMKRYIHYLSRSVLFLSSVIIRFILSDLICRYSLSNVDK